MGLVANNGRRSIVRWNLDKVEGRAKGKVNYDLR